MKLSFINSGILELTPGNYRLIYVKYFCISFYPVLQDSCAKQCCTSCSFRPKLDPRQNFLWPEVDVNSDNLAVEFFVHSLKISLN